MRWLDYPLYRLLGFFILGIVIARYVDLPWTDVIMFAIALGSVFVLGYFIYKFSHASRWIFTLSSCFLFTVIGIVSYQIKTKFYPPNHLTQMDEVGGDQLIDFTLKQQLATNEYNNRFYASLNSIDGSVASGDILVLFKKSDSVKVSVGSRLVVYDDINDASAGRNPGDFNYKIYLESIDVYGQVYVDVPRIVSITAQTDLSWYVELRNTLLEKLETSELHEQPRAMIEALILGQRQNVDPSISRSFRDAGVIHILALSGLHVGIILLILRFATSWMHRLPSGTWLQAALLIILLWCFALLTGLSPSIMRAVTMFSFVALGLAFKKNSSVFHSLTASALFLLLIDPRLLFQVGFQLSYTAVIGIVLMQPLFLSIFPRFRNYILRILVNTFCVTLAAQLAVAPLSAYYFHQLPLSFLLGNMLLLPVLPIIIGLSILFMLMLLVNAPTVWFAMLLNSVLESIIDMVALISSWSSLIIKDIFMDTWQVILLYIVLLGIVLYIKPHISRSKKEQFILIKPNSMLHVALAAMILLVAGSIYYSSNEQHHFMVLHQSRASAISLANNDHARLYFGADRMQQQRIESSIKRLLNVSFLQGKPTIVDSIPNLITYQNQSIFIIDEPAAMQITSDVPKGTMILLRNSPKINLEILIYELQPKAIISDGSNYPSDVKLWSATCKKMEVRFLNTYADGAIDLLQF